MFAICSRDGACEVSHEQETRASPGSELSSRRCRRNVVRATPDATVSMSVPWKDLSAKLDPKEFTVKTAPKVLRRRKDPFAELA